MRIVITGSTGFIGSYVVRDLAHKGHEVLCAIREGTDIWRLNDIKDSLNFFTVDYNNIDSWINVLPCEQIDGFIHLGWTGVAGSARNELSQVSNIMTSAELVLLTHQLKGRFFISTGSQAEYARYSGKMDENCVEGPTTLYGKAKLSTKNVCEHLCQEYGIRYAWMRVFSTYGPMDNDWWMIPSLINKISLNEVPPLTLGEQKWDFLHVRDAAAAIVSVSSSDNASGVFNLGSGNSPQLKATIELIRDTINPQAELGFGNVPYRDDQVMHLEADISKLNKVVGWSPKVRMADGIKETVAWFCSDKVKNGC